MRVFAMDQPQLAPFSMPARFRHDIAYFMTPAGEPGVPKLAQGEYWIRLSDSRCWLDAGGLELISPLDSQNKTEVELSEEQEAWLEWMIEHEVQHVRVEP